MKPIHTASSNMVYIGPPGVGDLHCNRVEPGIIQSVWHLSLAERRAIAAGANVMLTMWQEPVPPVALEVTDEQGIGEDDPAARARIETLKQDLITREEFERAT